MGLIHTQHPGWRLREGCAHILALQGLGCREHDQRATFLDALERGSALCHAECPVETYDRRATLAEALLLVGHQRDQGRDHHGRLRREQRGELIDQRLAVARREHGQQVLAGQHGLQRAALEGVQAPDAEALPRQRLRPAKVTRHGLPLRATTPPG